MPRRIHRFVDEQPTLKEPARKPVLVGLALPTAVTADHLRLVVRSNTCTGTPDFRGDRDNDPANTSDCPSTDNAYRVTITEFQAFGR